MYIKELSRRFRNLKITTAPDTGYTIVSPDKSTTVFDCKSDGDKHREFEILGNILGFLDEEYTEDEIAEILNKHMDKYKDKLELSFRTLTYYCELKDDDTHVWLASTLNGSNLDTRRFLSKMCLINNYLDKEFQTNKNEDEVEVTIKHETSNIQYTLVTNNKTPRTDVALKYAAYCKKLTEERLNDIHDVIDSIPPAKIKNMLNHAVENNYGNLHLEKKSGSKRVVVDIYESRYEPRDYIKLIVNAPTDIDTEVLLTYCMYLSDQLTKKERK